MTDQRQRARPDRRRMIAAVLVALTGCGEAAPPVAGPVAPLADRLRVADAERGRAVFARCSGCHSITRGAGDRDGPALFGVMGAPVARTSGRFGYTYALRSVGGRWTPARMDAWLTSPRRFAPGTSMPFAGIADPAQRADVIAYLMRQR